MAEQTLVEAVLAGGATFPVGTVRGDEGTTEIPDGPWWSPAESDDEPKPATRSRAKAKSDTDN